MFGQQYKLMDRYYVRVGVTFRGIIQEPLFLETTQEGMPLASRPERLDGWYLGVPTGRRVSVPGPLSGTQLLVGVMLALGTALLTGK